MEALRRRREQLPGAYRAERPSRSWVAPKFVQRAVGGGSLRELAGAPRQLAEAEQGGLVARVRSQFAPQDGARPFLQHGARQRPRDRGRAFAELARRLCGHSGWRGGLLPTRTNVTQSDLAPQMSVQALRRMFDVARPDFFLAAMAA